MGIDDLGSETYLARIRLQGFATSSQLELLLDPTAQNDWTVIANQNTMAAMATAAAPSLEAIRGRLRLQATQRGAVKTVDAKHRGSLTSTPVVAEITYDVRGQRESISYAATQTEPR